MSKSVRLPDYLAAEIERLAGEEKRSLANMVRILLEQALRLDVHRPEEETVKKILHAPTPTAAQVAVDNHFKPDFKK